MDHSPSSVRAAHRPGVDSHPAVNMKLSCPLATVVQFYIYLPMYLHHIIRSYLCTYRVPFSFVCDDYLEKPSWNFLCSCSEIPIYIPIPTYTVFAEFTPLTECLLPSGALQSRANFRRVLFCRKHASYILAVNVLSIPLTLNRIVCLPDVIFFHLQQSIVYNICVIFILRS